MSSYSFAARQYAEENSFRLCTAGEVLQTHEVIILDPYLFLHELDRFPHVVTEVVVVALNRKEMPSEQVLNNIGSVLSIEHRNFNFLMLDDLG